MSKYQHQRGDDDGVVVGHIRATDTVISGLQRWGMFVAILIGFGVQIGVTLTKFSNVEQSISKMESSIATLSDLRNDLKTDVKLLQRSNEQQQKEIDKLAAENLSLRGEMRVIREMREAYVYDSAKEAKRALLNKATVPP